MSDLAKVSKQWHAARDRERQLAALLYAEIRLTVLEGMSESEAARVARVDRMTVRRALGKL